MAWIAFFCGMLVGTSIGVFVMGLMFLASTRKPQSCADSTFVSDESFRSGTEHQDPSRTTSEVSRDHSESIIH